MQETYSIVPISAKSGEGIPDLLSLMVYWIQKSMVEKLNYSKEVQCTVLEVKYVEGFGTTIDVVLVNGVLPRRDQIVVCGNQGTPIVTRIQSLLTPEPMKELRVKGKYQHHSEIRAAQAIKITAPQDVRKASVMLEKKMLAFDVKVTPEAQKLADELGVKIFCW